MRAHVLQSLDDREGGRIAHVVRIGLEGEAQHRDRGAANLAAQRLDHFLGHGALALVVDARHRLDDADGRAEILRRLDQRLSVLRETRPAIARPGIEEFRPDAPIEADAPGGAGRGAVGLVEGGLEHEADA